MQAPPVIAMAVNSKGEPLQIEMTVRDSQVSPGLKIGFLIPTGGGLAAVNNKGDKIPTDTPPELPPKIPTCPEFRLGLN